jgi:hypothetical protein
MGQMPCLLINQVIFAGQSNVGNIKTMLNCQSPLTETDLLCDEH